MNRKCSDEERKYFKVPTEGQRSVNGSVAKCRRKRNQVSWCQRKCYEVPWRPVRPSLRSISDGYASKDPDNQLLHWVHDDTFPTHEIRIWNPAICIPNSVKEPSSGNRQKIRNAGGQMKDELSRFKQTTKGLLTKTSS